MATSSWLTCADFTPYVGEELAATAGDVALVLVLTDASESSLFGGTGPEGQSRLQFSLEFRGPHDPALEQGIVTVTHPALGDLDLFLVPIGLTPEGARYEAAFA